jgi:pimeloyl-ACP methyl ester carboxylesterase
VRSADGTAIEYLTAGDGPPVIVIPGALGTASDLLPFARLLAPRYTVHVVQRRGRGGSGPQGDQYGVERECEDLDAVRAATGARLLFGHSFGGLVVLRAACGTGISGSAASGGRPSGGEVYDAVAVYEPGVSVDGSIPVDWIGRAREEISTKASFDAFLTLIRGVNPDQAGREPRWLLRVILRLAISRAAMRQNLALMPQAINEHVEVGRMAARFADYQSVTAATLVMRGKGRDTDRQAVALSRLSETILQAEIAVFGKLDHLAPEKKPGDIADAVLLFFAAHR